MTLALFIKKIQNNQTITFDETITIISKNYHYSPAEFTNGSLVNSAGTNEGSCKIFAFAMQNNLDKQQTLALFGDYYRNDVLNDPDGTGHQNIRNFMRYGWDGLQFNGNPLTAK
ncbi:HopJ type III effector protein [Crenothrix polyspora]|uniref:HopJ type III effector protein n=1 Tax=Crenothrix polyspora TaxID=360316 RepID=A0A1R4HCD0_9GAMM|nr:HopJ type III effector protein [Crenothrix polyspora]SJM93902.1 HopJ type III effector protein [Crenothrix polyspora]